MRLRLPILILLACLTWTMLAAVNSDTVLDTLQWGLLAIIAMIGTIGLRIIEAIEGEDR